MSSQGDITPASNTPEWMRREERGSIFWLRIMRWLSLTLGRRLSRTIVYGIALYFVLAVPSARKASRAYLARCLNRPVTWIDLYRHFLAFSSTLHDRVYLISHRQDLFKIRTFGTESLHALHSSNKGVLLFGAHLGSFEVLRSLAHDDPRLKVCVAMYPENARQINDALAVISPQALQDIIALGKIDSILAIHNKLKEGAMVGILADRAAGPNHADQYINISFLGAPARFPIGPFRMAVMLRCPVYFMTGLYRGGNRYDVHFELLTDFSKNPTMTRDAAVREVLEKYVAALERHCKAASFNWFNFYDFWEHADCDNA